MPEHYHDPDGRSPYWDHCLRPVINLRRNLSPAARSLYDQMAKLMTPAGFLDLDSCLDLSIEALESAGGHEGLLEILDELQENSLAFPHPSDAGWVVRLPLRASAR